MPLIEIVISAIVSLGIEHGLDQALRNEQVMQLLSKFGYNPDTLPDNFDDLYNYTLILYGIGKPKPILDFFKIEFIKDAFRQSFVKNDFPILEHEATQVIQWHPIGQDLLRMDITIATEFSAFVEIFKALVLKARRPTQIHFDEKIDDLAKRIIEGQEHDEERFDKLENGISKVQQLLQTPKSEIFKRQSVSDVPLLPDYYVERERYIEKLLSILVDHDPINKKPNRGVALLGFAGAGKTILAQALSAHASIKKQFNSGILWAELGPTVTDENDLDTILSDWLISYGIIPEFYPSFDDKISIIRKLLSEEKRLVVINDAWSIPPARLMLSLCGQDSKYILTSRNKELVQRLGITETIEIGNLETNEARKLIENRLQHQVSDDQWDKQIIPILNRVDFNALAVSLLAAQVAIGDKEWKELFAELEDFYKKIPMDFDHPHVREESINLSIDLSVRQLDNKSKVRFIWLGILAREEYYVLEQIAMLWSTLIFPDFLDEVNDIEGNLKRNDYVRKEAEETLNLLFRLGLIDITHFRDGITQYHIHGLVFEYALRSLYESNELDNATLAHTNIYLSLLVTSSPVYSTDFYLYEERQVTEMLVRAWRTYSNEQGIKIQPLKLAKFVIYSAITALRNYWRYGGKNEALILWLKRAIKICREDDDRVKISQLLSHLGDAYIRLGDYDAAISSSKEALEILIAIGDTESIATEYGSLASYYIAADEYDEGIGYSQKSLEALRDIDNQSIKGKAYGNLGNAYNGKGDVDNAIHWLELALNIAYSENDVFNIGQRTGNLASAYTIKGLKLIRNSIRETRKSLGIARALGNRQSEGNQLMNLSRAYLALGKIGFAKICCEESIHVLSEIKSPQEALSRKYLDYLNGRLDDTPLAISPDLMLELTFEVIQGDRLAKAELFPWLDYLQKAPNIHDELKELSQKITEILSGERDIGKIIAGLRPELSINLQTMLITLNNPEKGNFSRGLVKAIFDIIKGNPEVSTFEKNMVQIGLVIPNLRQTFEEVSLVLAKLREGERDSVVSTNVNDEELARIIKTAIQAVGESNSTPPTNLINVAQG